MSGADLRGVAFSPVLHASLALLVLIVPTVLSVFRPPGSTGYRQRRQGATAPARQMNSQRASSSAPIALAYMWCAHWSTLIISASASDLSARSHSVLAGETDQDGAEILEQRAATVGALPADLARDVNCWV